MSLAYTMEQVVSQITTGENTIFKVQVCKKLEDICIIYSRYEAGENISRRLETTALPACPSSHPAWIPA